MRTPISATHWALFFCFVSAGAAAGCDKGSDGGAAPTTTTAATAVTASAHATSTTAPMPSGTPAVASGAASAEPATEAPGTVRIHLDSARVVSGKSDAAEKTMKSNLLKLRNECLVPALKKQPSIEGTLKVVLELGPDGKVQKATTTVPTGKIPDDLQTCVKGFYEKNLGVDTNKAKAKIEATIAVGPNVQPDK
jgi:hypothetical protein